MGHRGLTTAGQWIGTDILSGTYALCLCGKGVGHFSLQVEAAGLSGMCCISANGTTSGDKSVR